MLHFTLMVKNKAVKSENQVMCGAFFLQFRAYFRRSLVRLLFRPVYKIE